MCGVPLLMNYNAFNGGGGAREESGGICSVVKIFSCKAKSAAAPEMAVGFIKKKKKIITAKTVKQT